MSLCDLEKRPRLKIVFLSGQKTIESKQLFQKNHSYDAFKTRSFEHADAEADAKASSEEREEGEESGGRDGRDVARSRDKSDDRDVDRASRAQTRPRDRRKIFYTTIV
jgi:hypothetical protein